jgi:uncharacterized protein (DUF1778 family)
MTMNRTTTVRARVNESERAALVRMAAAEGRGTSEMLREAIREAAVRRNLWPPKPVSEGVQAQ